MGALCGVAITSGVAAGMAAKLSSSAVALNWCGERAGTPAARGMREGIDMDVLTQIRVIVFITVLILCVCVLILCVCVLILCVCWEWCEAEKGANLF